MGRGAHAAEAGLAAHQGAAGGGGAVPAPPPRLVIEGRGRLEP